MAEKEILAALRQATNGLLYPSETDAPVEALEWPGETGPPTPGRLLALAGQKPGTEVETATLDDFFAELTRDEEWHGEAEKADVRRWRQLHEIFAQRLADAKVFRIGRTRIEILIVGRAPQGGWLGIKTMAVET